MRGTKGNHSALPVDNETFLCPYFFYRIFKASSLLRRLYADIARDIEGETVSSSWILYIFMLNQHWSVSLLQKTSHMTNIHSHVYK